MHRSLVSRLASALLLLSLVLLDLVSASPSPRPGRAASRRAAIPQESEEKKYELGDINNPNVKLLNSLSWDKETKKGMFLVEFFSPYCPHCRHFAPTWENLASMQEHLEDTAGFYLRRVNCVEQGDLCEARGVKFYPSLQLYVEGAKTEDYSGPRDYDALTSYVTARAADYRKLRAEKKKMADVVAADGMAGKKEGEDKPATTTTVTTTPPPAAAAEGPKRIRLAREINTLR